MIGTNYIENFHQLNEEQNTPFLGNESVNQSNPPLPKPKNRLFGQFVSQRRPNQGSKPLETQMQTVKVVQQTQQSHYNEGSDHNLDFNYYKNVERGWQQNQELQGRLRTGQRQVANVIRADDQQLNAGNRKGVFQSAHQADGLLVAPHIGAPTFLTDDNKPQEKKGDGGAEEQKTTGYQGQEYQSGQYEYEVSEYKSIYDS